MLEDLLYDFQNKYSTFSVQDSYNCFSNKDIILPQSRKFILLLIISLIVKNKFFSYSLRDLNLKVNAMKIKNFHVGKIQRGMQNEMRS